MRIEFPRYPFRVEERGGVRRIFDSWRRRFVALTPEEWVRQHLLRWLVEEKGYPASRIAVERALPAGGRPLRFDAVVYGPEVTPWMLVECKAPGVRLDQAAVDQAGRYNAALRAPWLALCNGEEAAVWGLDFEAGAWTGAADWPAWGNGSQGKMPRAR